MELFDAVRECVHTIVNGMDPTGTAYATVLSAAPLKLEIQSGSLPVEEPVAVLTDAVKYRDVVVDGRTIVINPGLVPGDKVLVIKANSGQNYIVISKA